MLFHKIYLCKNHYSCTITEGKYNGPTVQAIDQARGRPTGNHTEQTTVISDDDIDEMCGVESNMDITKEAKVVLAYF